MALITVRKNPARTVLRVKEEEIHCSHTEFEQSGKVLSALSSKKLEAGVWSSKERCSLDPDLWLSSTQKWSPRSRTDPSKCLKGKLSFLIFLTSQFLHYG